MQPYRLGRSYSGGQAFLPADDSCRIIAAVTIHHSHEHISTSTSAGRATTAGLFCLPTAAPRETERFSAT